MHPICRSILATCAALLTACPAWAQQPGRQLPPGVRVVSLPSTYWALYPRNTDLSIESIRKLQHGVGAELQLRSEIEDLAYFAYAVNEGPVTRSRDGKIRLRFRDTHIQQPMMFNVVLQAVGRSGVHSAPTALRLSYYPREWQAARGLTTESRVVVHEMDADLAGTRVRDLVLQRPDREERKYAKRKWGPLVKPERSNYDNAVAIASAILTELESRRGQPSDRMFSLMPFEQLERALSGADQVNCINLAAILAFACNANDIPCRTVGAGPGAVVQPDGEGDYVLALSATHTAVEVFSRDLNQWVWMDPFLRVLGAYLGEEGPLSAAEFHLFLNTPARLPRLRIETFDPPSGHRNTITVLQAGALQMIRNYYKRDQQLHFYIRDFEVPAS